MKLDLDNPNEEVRIEIIPLIDVIFCILTFFILAAVSLTRQQAISLDLPGADTSSPLPAETVDRERIYVSVDATGTTYIDQSPVPLDVIRDVIQQHRQIYPEGLVVLYAARDARYADVVTVLDLLREVGGDRVALATLPGADPSSEGLDPLTPGLDSPLPGSPVPGLDPSLNPGLNPGLNQLPEDGLLDPGLPAQPGLSPAPSLDTPPAGTEDPAAGSDD